MKILSILLEIWNIVVFFTYGTDKFLAKKRARRIRESTLILTAFLLGGIDAMFGMVIISSLRTLIGALHYCYIDISFSSY